jgi:hypothetical protein
VVTRGAALLLLLAARPCLALPGLEGHAWCGAQQRRTRQPAGQAPGLAGAAAR